MAEAIVAIGLAASILQLVDFSAKVLARLREFQSTVQTRIFQDIIVQLPLIIDIMNRIQKICTDSSLLMDVQQTQLSGVVEGCLEQVTLLNGG